MNDHPIEDAPMAGDPIRNRLYCAWHDGERVEAEFLIKGAQHWSGRLEHWIKYILDRPPAPEQPLCVCCGDHLQDAIREQLPRGEGFVVVSQIA
jgi:hypothetical protein